MLIKDRLRLLCLVSLTCALPRASGSIILEDWGVGVSVHDSHAGENVSQSFLNVPLPLVDSHAVSLGTPPDVSSAAASYSFFFSGSDGTGSFDVAAELAAFDVPESSLRSTAAGSFFIRTSVDTLLTVTGEYTFDLPPFDFITDFTFQVNRLDPFAVLLEVGDQAHSFDGHNTGTLSLDGSVIIPGDNARYEISYLMRLTSLGGDTAQTATGDGFVHFNLAPVPEPTTAALICLALPIVLRRRPKRR